MRAICVFLFLLVWTRSQSQASIYQNLFDAKSVGQEVLFVNSRPLRDIKPNPNRIRNKILDTLNRTVLAQILKNCDAIDTTHWQESELPGCLLVSSREEHISKKSALQKFSLNESQIRSYKKQINRFNSTDSYDRNIYSFSRPVFDDSKRFAIVMWNNAHSGLGGGGAIVLFQFQDGQWKKVGALNSWMY